MKDRIITVYGTPKLSPFDDYCTAFALDESNNLVWVSTYSDTDGITPLEEDEYMQECERDIPDFPKPLNKSDYKYLDCNHKDRFKIGEIILRYTNS